MADTTFLAELLRKEAAVKMVGEKSGKKIDSAVAEVKRQIRQCFEGKNIVTGEGVTKSGAED